LRCTRWGTYEGAPYLVSELLEGETLREQIKRGRVAVRKAMDCAIQIARGLAAAHEKGIVHRDLKPENLFVTKDGRVKILDFGLAKLTQPADGFDQGSPTLGSATEPGMVMGTVGYMAPEQVRGQAADHRADIFAFGAILYEMLAGKRAFQKPTSPETMTAILNEDPPGISQVVPNLPPALQRVVHRCLEKNPEQRFQSASDMAFALDALSDSGASVAATGTGKRWKVIVPPVIVLLAMAVGSYFYLHRTTKLTEKDTIVLADFVNHTDDPVFEDALKQALSVQLEQSPFLNILSSRKVSDTLKLMGHTPNEHITSELAKEICIRTRSKAVLEGSISRLGNEYLLGLNATACVTGDTLGGEQAETSSKEGVLTTLSTMASDMRAKLGESLGSVQKFDLGAEATTSSLEALRAYSMATRTLHARGMLEAIPFFKQAIELDPDFAKAYLGLGKMYAGLSEPNLAAENLTKAYNRRDRVSEREKYDISAEYFFQVTGELEKAIQTYQAWIQLYPRDSVPINNVSNIYLTLGE
jgi:serine/threonine protein kinase